MVKTKIERYLVIVSR